MDDFMLIAELNSAKMNVKKDRREPVLHCVCFLYLNHFHNQI